ncbi:MAG: reverse transcriptase-like protein [Peptococcaceae bacterium]|jgi:ribonuclease HI|nr:MAG: reverse transcriptase-like protein [Peptococcaceae bacterium]
MQVYVNIDGGSRGNPGPAAAAFVLQNSRGEVLASKGKFLGPGLTNNFAEWSALEGAVNALAYLAGRYGLIEAEIRADSELVVEQFNRRYKIRAPALQEIARRVRQRLQDNPKLKIRLVHIPRNDNKLADAIVNQELDAWEKRNCNTADPI